MNNDRVLQEKYTMIFQKKIIYPVSVSGAAVLEQLSQLEGMLDFGSK